MGQRQRALETLVRTDLWRGRRVLLTGDTGFKGSWLALWLDALGAQVTGFALPPPSGPSLYAAARIGDLIDHIDGDVRDFAAVSQAVQHARPDVVFHLAAQPLVRLSYQQPIETYATNVMGTVHLLEAARQASSVVAFVCVTSDKCYDNREWVWPYRENDPMGGHDPYSSSKGCAELVTSAYRSSFFPAAAMSQGAMGLASVRAGNVIGGGDWAADRLIPDLIRAFERGEAPMVRAPAAIRPWQHVLEALNGYLMVAERMLDGDPHAAERWNFGPSDGDARPVGWIVERMAELWGNTLPATVPDGTQPHEAGLLRLDSTKARSLLGWTPVLSLETALEWIVDWHRSSAAGDPRAVTRAQIAEYRALVETRPDKVGLASRSHRNARPARA